MSLWLLLTNFVATIFLVGLIWTIQIVHYPLFDRVGEREFKNYEADHASLITRIVLPVMLIEIATSFFLALGADILEFKAIFWLAFACVLGIWASTFLIQVPCHARLGQSFDQATYERLVHTNWIRTFLWTVRGALLCYIIADCLTHSDRFQ